MSVKNPSVKPGYVLTRRIAALKNTNAKVRIFCDISK